MGGLRPLSAGVEWKAQIQHTTAAVAAARRATVAMAVRVEQRSVSRPAQPAQSPRPTILRGHDGTVAPAAALVFAGESKLRSTTIRQGLGRGHSSAAANQKHNAAQRHCLELWPVWQPPSSEPLIIPVPTVARAIGDTHNSSQRPAVSSIQLPTRRRRSLGWVIGEERRRCKSGWMQQLVELARATAHPGIITDRDRDPWKGLGAHCGLAQCP